MRRHFYLTVVIYFMVGFLVSGQQPSPSRGGKMPTVADTARSNGTRQTGPPAQAKPGPKPYKEVITDQAVTSKGMFIVHKIEDKYFLEIPDSLLGRDILTVSRISKAAVAIRVGMIGFAGDEINKNVIRFEKGPNNKLFLKEISFTEYSKDSSENGMYRNVMNSNMQPVTAMFDIKAYNYISSNDKNAENTSSNTSSKKANSVIDFTDYCNGDNGILFFDNALRSFLKFGALQPDKSYINAVKSFPSNVEIKTVKSYTQLPSAQGAASPSSPATYEINTSLVLLPKDPMKPRYFDDRVGYFATGYTDFDKNPQGVEKVGVIVRFRLEPKEEDVERYKRGELVEPKKQIVYYIDPTTPKKWVSYLMQGVNDWQAAFEKAGFKNAIIAKEAPVNDSTWSIDDARHNAIVYKPSEVPNASGPNVHDPRSGEIIETHINWFHNVMQLLRNWYIIQAGAIDPRANKMVFDDALMGDLIRFVSSHEVGHTLGLRHNFGSSSTVPVEKLRDKNWLREHGHTPSIMDYARFNYVAQPEDGMTKSEIYPRIAEYDKWAIEWGYKWLPEFKTVNDEQAFLNKWIIDSLNSNPRLWFGTESDRLDPRCQNEDLGDDAMKAGAYGVKNLQRILPKLEEWTKQEHEVYSELSSMHKEVASQFGRYLGHVTKNIGGVKTTPKSVEQSGAVVEFVSKATQKEAMKFLQEQLFKTPEWLINKKYSLLTGSDPLQMISTLQEATVGRLFSAGIGYSLLKAEIFNSTEAYTLSEMWNDLKAGVWSELKTHKPIDIYRKCLQKSYVDKLLMRVKGKADASASSVDKYNEIPAIARAHAKTLAAEIKAAIPLTTDVRTKAHLQDMWELFDEVLNPK